MPGKAIVAATDATLTTAPPRPAGPPGRMARKACLRPSAVPRTLTSSIFRMSSGFRSATRLEISTPALLTTMSRPPSSAIVPSMHRSQLWSSVTFSGRNAASPPDFLIASTVASPSSSRMSPMTTAAPARARASAIPAPRPRAPPVTRALRPVRSYTLMWDLLLETALVWWSHHRPPPRRAAVRRRSHCHAVLTVVKTFLDSCQGGTSGCGNQPGSGLAAPGRQVRRTARAASRRRAADAGRARLRPDQPARDRAEHRVLARRAALLLQRQGRPDHALRAPVRGGLRDPLRRDRGVGFVGGGAQAGVQRGDGADAANRRAHAPALV